MNIVELEEKLLRVARRQVPPDAVPYGFEQRVMALVREQGAASVDYLAFWGRALWRGAASTVAVMGIAALLLLALAPGAGQGGTVALGDDLADTVQAPLTFNQLTQSW